MDSTTIYLTFAGNQDRQNGKTVTIIVSLLQEPALFWCPCSTHLQEPALFYFANMPVALIRVAGLPRALTYEQTLGGQTLGAHV
jgi:hypothetical protein